MAARSAGDDLECNATPPHSLFRTWLLGGLLIAFIPTVFFFAQLTRPGGLLNLLQFGVGGEKTTVASVAALQPPRHRNYSQDGQYYAQMAMDPFMRDPQTVAAMDYAAYRAHRIFLPLIAHLLGMGQASSTLNILASLNYIFFLILLAAVLYVVKPENAAQWAGVSAAVLTTGSMDSLRAALTDLPASVFIFVAVMLPVGMLRIALLAAAVLTREIVVLSAIPCALGRPLFGWINLIRMAGVILPMGLLLLYIHAHLSAWGGSPGQNFHWPGFAIAERMATGWSEILQRPDQRSVSLFLAPLCLFAQGIYLWRYRQTNSALWWSGVAYFPLLLLLGPGVWEGTTSAPRALLPMTIAFNVLLALRVRPHFWIWFVVGNAGLFWGLRKLMIDTGRILF